MNGFLSSEAVALRVKADVLFLFPNIFIRDNLDIKTIKHSFTTTVLILHSVV